MTPFKHSNHKLMEAKIGERSVSIIGQGTYGFGGYFNREAGHEKELAETLRHGISLGMRFIDTAEVYGSGMSEEIVGKAISGLKREDVFIATKVWRNHLEYDDVIASCKNSLERMKLKSVDLYQIHWPDESTPIKETMRAFEKLADDGLIRNIGVSNFSVRGLKEAIGALSRYELKSNQVHYNLDHRNIEREVLPFCKENRISVIAYSPLGTGDLLHGRKAKVLSEIGAKYGGTKAQVALNWLVSKGVISIPKASRKEHVTENAKSTDFMLTKEDVASLEAA
ncbi:MAG: aldo/keto reductase [Nitrososphaerales archaeon]